MVFSQGSRSALGFIDEVTFGTTPATPTLVTIPINSHSLDLTKQTLVSAQIRADRQVEVLRHGNRNIIGDIDVDFRAADFDSLLQSAFFGTKASGVLKVGTTKHSLTIEDQAQDITQYRLFTGCMVSSMDMSIKPNAMVVTKFSIQGKDMAQGATSASGSALSAASGNQPMDSFTGVMKEGGSTTAILAGVDFKIDNGLKPTYVLGSAATPNMEYGLATVTGTVTAYYQDATLINKFINETSTSLEFNLTDGTNTYQFKMPKVKYTGAAVPIANPQSRMVTLPFQALYNSADSTNLILTIS